MMADTPKDRALMLIGAGHQQLSKFAQDSYGMHGRGVTLVSVPALPPPGATMLVLTDMVYHEMEEVRRMVGDMADGQVMIRMMETYDPTKQAVVTAAVGQDNPITVKMRLDQPYVVEES
jgi:hypothetical protein